MGSVLALILLCAQFSARSSAREALTDKEEQELRDAQQIDRRTELYLKIAALRLETFKERARGVESKPGDPLEFHSLEDMLSTYARAIRAIMGNIDDAIGYKKQIDKSLVTALRKLKIACERYKPDLEFALKYAIDKKDERLYDLARQAIEMTETAYEGAQAGLDRYEPLFEKKKRK